MIHLISLFGPATVFTLISYLWLFISLFWLFILLFRLFFITYLWLLYHNIDFLLKMLIYLRHYFDFASHVYYLYLIFMTNQMNTFFFFRSAWFPSYLLSFTGRDGFPIPGWRSCRCMNKIKPSNHQAAPAAPSSRVGRARASSSGRAHEDPMAGQVIMRELSRWDHGAWAEVGQGSVGTSRWWRGACPVSPAATSRCVHTPGISWRHVGNIWETNGTLCALSFVWQINYYIRY